MDLFINGAVDTGVDMVHRTPELPAASFPVVLVAIAVWLLELQRRTADAPAQPAPGAGGSQSLCRTLLRRFAPELVGLALLTACAGAALAQGGTKNEAAITHERVEKAWAEMQARWPLLSTPDTFVALQAMLRVGLLATAVFRAAEAEASPLMGESIYLLLLAAGMRVTMLALSPPDGYTLDGPLGGSVNLVFEAASLVLLVYLSGLALRKGLGRDYAPFFAVAVALVGWVACHNHLMLTGPENIHLDVLNSYSEGMELLAAFAFFARTIRGEAAGAFSTFAHVLLPFQQLLPVCFHLMAWGAKPLEEVPDITGAGQPLIVLQLGGAAQVGLYLLAATWHFCSLEVAVKDGRASFLAV